MDKQRSPTSTQRDILAYAKDSPPHPLPASQTALRTRAPCRRCPLLRNPAAPLLRRSLCCLNLQLRLARALR